MDGRLIVEVGYDQDDAVTALATASGLAPRCARVRICRASRERWYLKERRRVAD